MIISDKRDDWGFRNFGQVEIKEISEEIIPYVYQWELDQSRQESYVTHENTKMFQLIGMDYFYGIAQEKISIVSNTMVSEKANAEMLQIYNKIEEVTNGKIIRSEFINMKPKSRVRMHKDRSDLLYLARRFHIPIKTNDFVEFTSGRYVENLKVGNLYELNNINYHGVKNGGNSNRIHLIVDSLPNEYCDNLRIVDETKR